MSLYIAENNNLKNWETWTSILFCMEVAGNFQVIYSTWSQTCTSQICRFFLPSFGGRMVCAFSLEKSRSLYLVIGPMWQKFIYLSIPQYSKTDWPIPLFGPRSSPFMNSDVIFLQAKWSKIKERVEGWKSGKTSRFKRITVWSAIICTIQLHPKSKQKHIEAQQCIIPPGYPWF